jgi:plasmid stability protein
MANLTITIDDEILHRARLRALEQHTSVNALLRDYLDAFAAAGATWDQATDAILRLSAQAGSGRGDRRWTRDELHERR